MGQIDRYVGTAVQASRPQQRVTDRIASMVLRTNVQ